MRRLTPLSHTANAAVPTASGERRAKLVASHASFGRITSRRGSGGVRDSPDRRYVETGNKSCGAMRVVHTGGSTADRKRCNP